MGRNKAYGKFLKMLAGFLVLVSGITMMLLWWPDFVRLCRGFIGFAAAIGGLLVLYSIKD